MERHFSNPTAEPAPTLWTFCRRGHAGRCGAAAADSQAAGEVERRLLPDSVECAATFLDAILSIKRRLGMRPFRFGVSGWKVLSCSPPSRKSRAGWHPFRSPEGLPAVIAGFARIIPACRSRPRRTAGAFCEAGATRTPPGRPDTADEIESSACFATPCGSCEQHHRFAPHQMSGAHQLAADVCRKTPACRTSSTSPNSTNWAWTTPCSARQEKHSCEPDSKKRGEHRRARTFCLDDPRDRAKRRTPSSPKTAWAS